MESRLKNINSFWGYLLIDELVRNEITYFCISPGSRSTPLTIAAAENKQAEIFVCLDERGAAFHAVGYARASEKPAVLICTSGTAAANYYPAIVEAKNSQIPIIILTADRPPELRDTAANQTIDQVKMFGNFLNWQFDLPCPDVQLPPEMVLTTIDHAVQKSIKSPAGPVHLNCMFREPLEPFEKPFSGHYSDSVANRENSNQPFTNYIDSLQTVVDSYLSSFVDLINKTNNGWLVVGQLNTQTEKKAIAELALKLHWPVFADITSGIRNATDLQMLIPYFDHFLLADKTKGDLCPELVLHFGRPLTSKRYLKAIERLSSLDYIHIDPSNERMDPAHLITQRICGDIGTICQKLIEKIEPNLHQEIKKFFSHKEKKIDQIIDRYCSPDKQISEISVARLISKHLPENLGLFLGSSMPIRDFNMYAGSHLKTRFVTSNRGVSGIDGTIASALGYANGLKKQVTVVLGDLAMIHDLNSLSQVSHSVYPLIIVVVNNSGGGIFSFLPVSGFKHVFDQYFATSHTYRFNQASHMFDIDYENPATNQEFIQSYKKSIDKKRSTIIEINTDRKENFIFHQKMQRKIITDLEK